MKNFERFGRILVPMITPFFKDDQSVDYKTARKVARYLKEHNLCDSIIVAGTTGEFHSLTKEERTRTRQQPSNVHAEASAETSHKVGIGKTQERVEETRETLKEEFK